MRTVAEAEMRRINHIAGILTHPEERLRYDRTLGEAEALQEDGKPERGFRTFPALIRFDLKAGVWLAAGVFVTLIGEFALGRRSEAPLSETPAVASAPPATTSARVGDTEPRPDRAPLPAPPVASEQPVAAQPVPPPEVTEPQPAVEKQLPPRSVARPAQALVVPPPEGTLPREEAAPPDVPAEPRTEPAGSPAPVPVGQIRPARRNSGFVGLWRYARATPAPSEPGLFPAEEVEIGIAQQFGVIYGYYNGRYTVRQASIAPEVSFRFSGPAGKTVAKTNWSSGDGSRGEISLRMLSEDSLEVIWVASRISPGHLASGRITLTRVE
jgi:hypothetical protein